MEIFVLCRAVQLIISVFVEQSYFYNYVQINWGRVPHLTVMTLLVFFFGFELDCDIPALTGLHFAKEVLH